MTPHEHVGDDWVAHVRTLPGVHRVDPHERDDRRVVAEISAEAFEALRESLLDQFHVEELIPHFPRKR